ncbi:hypothetical protein PCANC_15317 [Puccinia coronata f. sp. avenae]|uniref:Uncharacterized protein n=1 Tax=Puccinia coronata f. sp. avenae TaxID=200324 RepID=A0A2N5S564_9BASI|nr:hypothetical protein PCANC_25217 [Puccinia coronata f. sp. avenae]PLW30203.1 hypothetical protein PCASD_18249 [Puccinia coronata f. sp. avenae]PLW39314.1 hypothetical protein PCANC_15317 [Puccinia coronata f. sp. avenae]
MRRSLLWSIPPHLHIKGEWLWSVDITSAKGPSKAAAKGPNFIVCLHNNKYKQSFSPKSIALTTAS